ncbi:uncharacterized protein LOC108863645 [Galendromus occidentalis]|uniref:Uncharacterized protein LOC108863645 n=1 Tax=Galendromus occidentalis TaxID=34638 RepID=A0AAJ7SFP9_9ACAR|nr:uncharacterized protein LOC108863645 [Galendromus occidentalis]
MVKLAVTLLIGGAVLLQQVTAQFDCPHGWTRDSVYCFKFFSNKHSWRRAEEVCRRYGSQLALVLNYHQNNFTRALATEGLKDQPQNAYWLGLKSVKDLATNTLESSSGYFIPKYVGHWSLDQPQPEKGQCVHAQVGERTQEWGLTSCETMLPFVCQVPACPTGTFLCASGKCLNKKWQCDGVDDCGDGSDEMDCPRLCHHYLKSSGDSIQSPNYPQRYDSNLDCKWTLEGPLGTGIVLQFSDFETEANFDAVQVLSGGRTEKSSVSLAQLSGKQNISSKSYITGSNLMIVKFKSDAAAEKKGFRASWKTEPVKCGGELFAHSSAQVLNSPGYPNAYPGGIECLWVITAPHNKLVSLEIVDLDLEVTDSILLRDGATPSDTLLARLGGKTSENPKFILSTQNRVYIYFKTDTAHASSKGFSIRFRAGCQVDMIADQGIINSPAFGVGKYPSNQNCAYRITRPGGGPISLKFDKFLVASDDHIQVYDGQNAKSVKLHAGQGYSGAARPTHTLTATSGSLYVVFQSNSLNTAAGWQASFSSDCPLMTVGERALASSRDTTFGAEVTYTCPSGMEFSTGRKKIVAECLPGGKWSVAHIPSCQEIYCGPVPQISSGFAVAATNVTFRGQATYQCYAGFTFPGGLQQQAVRCNEYGNWDNLPVCMASSCPPLPEVPNAVAKFLNGAGRNYGTVVRFDCEPGFRRSGYPVVVCKSNGLWSANPPSCQKAQCHKVPKIENGIVVMEKREYLFGDKVKVQCNKGYKLEGQSTITCGSNKTFEDVPTCVDINECSSPTACDSASTMCINTPGSFFCKCKKGFERNVDCRPVGDLGLANGAIPDHGITVSSSETGYPKEKLRLDGEGGWCGSVPRAGENFVQIDLAAPTVIRGLRTQPVIRQDGGQAFPISVRIQYTDEVIDVFRDYTDALGRPMEFSLTPNGGSGLAVVHLPLPIEARFVRVLVMEYVGAPCMRLEVMGCSRQDCIDVNECLQKNGGCHQRCVNSPGGFHCMCNVGYELYTKNGTSGFFVPPTETGYRDGDTYQINKTCVPRECSMLRSPENGRMLSTKERFRFGDSVSFQCDFGFVLHGAHALTCTSGGNWNGTMPACLPAKCLGLHDDPAQGLSLRSNSHDNYVAFQDNVTISCSETGRPLRNTATSEFRQCVYNPQPGKQDYWLAGSSPACERVDCGPPLDSIGATYGFHVDTKYRASFFFGCEETFTLVGKSSLNDNVIRCQEDGSWDFGDLRCEGPVCQDPGRPADGYQIANSYEQGSEVTFGCTRPGYVPYSTDPITCVKNADCKVVKPLGITSGKIPDSAINATSARSNYEAKNVRMGSTTGWCGTQEAFTYVTVDLQKVHHVKAIMVKGVITNDVVGRPTELRFFYKVKENENFVVYFPNFNLTSRDPGNYGELTVIDLPLSVKARYVILGIVSYNKNPCLKFELLGCEDSVDDVLLGYESAAPVCVDKEPPRFENCPTHPIVVESSTNGILPVNFPVPTATDNSGRVARMEIKPLGFRPPQMVFEDTVVQYIAYDHDGNVAVCVVNITVPDYTPPSIKCPQSYVVELTEKQESFVVNFNETRAQISANDKSGHVDITVTPETAVIPIGGYRNITVTGTDRFGNQAFCYFQVSVQATSCVDWSLHAPTNGIVNCLPNDEATGYQCLATCKNGYRFTDGEKAKTFECKNKGPWLPKSIIPDCVSEQTNQASYDVTAQVEYRSGGAVHDSCLDHYVRYVRTFYERLNRQLSDRCSAINVQMDLSFHNTTAMIKSENELTIDYVVRIVPVVHQKLLYDLCGSTLGLIFDLSVPSTSALIEPILNISAQEIGGLCPTIQAKRSTIKRGFTCEFGEVLTNETGIVPRCLHCPAGTFAAEDEKCSFCPRGFYQDLTRQAQCKKCPDGTHTREEGSKSLSDCVPVCGYGTYSASGLVPCLQCPENSFAGTPPPEGFRECTKCQPNSFTYSDGAAHASACKARCRPGSYSETGLEPCYECPANFYQPQDGQTQCIRCASNQKTNSPGQTTPEACQPVQCNPTICKNGGLCLAQNHQATCYCPAGFTGQYCENDMEECASNPCYNGGSCIDRPQGFACKCPTGYSGSQCEIEKSECDVPNICPERAMCQDLPGSGSVNCLCRSGYEGPTCNVTVNPCTVGQSPCHNEARCIPLKHGRYKCSCAPGWTGPNCESNIDDCAESPCLLGANCTDLVNDFACECPPGFTGKRCQIKVDLCANNPCGDHGVCVDKMFSHECVCKPGWSGPGCEDNVDECVSSPCQNNGVCIDMIDGFRCQCDSGFTGMTCQHHIDDCKSEPCQNGGSCVDQIDGFTCECRPGFVGLQCEAEIDECLSLPCHATGTAQCIDKDNGFECVCNAGYRGEFCEVDIDECEASPCENGAKCIDKVGSFYCNCPPGWTGERCDVDIGGCDSNPCLNNARCIDLFEDFFCVCPSGTDGKRCQTSPQRCIGDPCMHGSSCQDYGSGLNCSCSEEFAGIGCQYEFDACAENVCQNGGKCQRSGKTYVCDCPPGYGGKMCEQDIQDCSATSCPPNAECIDLTNGFYCKCPFNYTGEDCRKQVSINYDLYFNDESRSSGAALNTPFDLNATSFSLGLWVQFNTPGSSGNIVTLYSVSHMHKIQNKTRLLKLDDSGVRVSFFPRHTIEIFIPYLDNVPINDGNWHHVVVQWDGQEGTLTLITDTALAGVVTGYVKGERLPPYGWLSLGAPVDTDEMRTKPESGFHGRLSRVNIWDRVLDQNHEIPGQFRSCQNSPVLFNGLLVRWANYDKIVGTVERQSPGRCGEQSCTTTVTEECIAKVGDKVPPRTIYCPPDMWVVTPNDSIALQWEEPEFSDETGQKVAISELNGIRSGHTFSKGIFDLSYVAKDVAGNQAQCDFRIHVLNDFCPIPPAPIGGYRQCSDWGPGSRFKVCSIGCDDGLDFSEKVPQFFVCGAEGFWRPNDRPELPFTFPACAPKRPAQRLFRIAMDFSSTVVCSDSGKKILRSRITEALLQVNDKWHVCVDRFPPHCTGTQLNVKCHKNGGRAKRQADKDGEPVSIYSLEISFPARKDPVVSSENQQKATVRSVVEQAILQANAFDVRETLPNVQPDLTSLKISTDYSCGAGEVPVNTFCVKCSLGTFYNNKTSTCDSCPNGFYQDASGQLACKACPEINGKQGITASFGARSVEECKQRCTPGQYFDATVGFCRPCGYGFYQPEEGSFKCEPCGPGLTTRTNEAASIQECREECKSGLQLTITGQCEPCPKGTFRTSGMPSCQQCPKGRTTADFGSTTVEQCSLEVCQIGHYLNVTRNYCMPCPKGTYQDEEQRDSECKPCPADTTTDAVGATDPSYCSDPCMVNGEKRVCHKNAYCVFIEDEQDFACKCMPKFKFSNETAECVDVCEDYCENGGKCEIPQNAVEPRCVCHSNFYGERCERKSDFVYVAGGIAAAVVFLIVMVLLIWMICVRMTWRGKPGKMPLPPAMDLSGSQQNFYYGAPAPYAESIAPSHHSTYAHYYDDEDDGWEMPNFYNETYMKDGLHKGGTLARSNASLYGTKEDLYDRLRRHQYTGHKKDSDTEDQTS